MLNNLNRIRGILSARQGAQVPKFDPGGKMYSKSLPFNVTVYSKDGQNWFQDELCTQEYTDPYKDSMDFQLIAQQEIDIPTSIPGDLGLTPTSAVEVSAKQMQEVNQVLSDNVVQDISESKQVKVDTQKQNGNEQSANMQVNNQKSGYENINTTMVSGIGTGAQALGNVLGAYHSATDSTLTKSIDAGYDATAGIVSQFSPVAGAAMQIIGAAGSASRLITGGNDQQTDTDKVLSSKVFSSNIGAINDLYGKNSDAFSTDVEALATVGSSYGGTAADIAEAAQKADKKYGLFSSVARRKANEAAKKVAATQNIMSGIADTARDQRLAVQSMGEQAGLAYSMMTDGGYNQKYTYAAKHGGLLEWNPVIELEWEPQVELNWELPTFKEGGSVEFVEELEWIPEFKSGNKIRTIEELIEYAKQQNPRFIQRLSEEPRGIKFTDDEGKEAEGSHYLESRGEYVIPRIQEVNGELQFFNSQDALNKALETGNYLKLSPEEAIIFAEQYKQGWPDFFKKFKHGGSVGDSDIPETEETTQKNVIPEGALHKNKHHMEHAEGLTKKGIPVVDEDGEQQAEIEHSEIIFTLEVTKKLEEYYEIFYSEESTNKEKEQAALDAGKLLVYQILENTEDRTGLIESCKKGGSLTLKKSTDDLIEEVLEWMPTIVVVETEEQEEKKEEKPKKKQVDDSKEELKQMIKEVLVEMLIK